MDKISIIVPVYKVPENLLRQCIESLINQSFENIEIILVDDGSPDNCGDICDKYAKKDNRIKVIHQKNRGLSGARNTGFFEAKGKWITFVDGDDWIDRDTCLKAIEATDINTELVFWTRMKEYDNRSIECYFIKGVERKTYINYECKELQENVLDFNSNISTAYAKLIKRDFLVNNKIIHDEELRQGAEGIEFNIRLFENLKNAVFINIPLYHYIYNDQSISANCSEENNEYVIRCFEKIKNYILQSKNKDKLLEKFYNRMIYVIITTAISGYFNPDNKESYKDKKEKYMIYLQNYMVKKSLSEATLKGLGMQRLLIILFIKLKWYIILEILGKLRKIQKNFS